MVSCSRLIAPLVAVGDLHTARFIALDYCFNRTLGMIDQSAAAECADAWACHVGKLLSGNLDAALEKIDAAHRRHYEKKAWTRRSLQLDHREPQPPQSATTQDNIKAWEASCRKVARHPRKVPPLGDLAECAIGEGSGATHLLPLLEEPSVCIRLPAAGVILDMDQDGLVQPFDVSTVLWPGGFLLSLWASEFVECLGNVGADTHPRWCDKRSLVKFLKSVQLSANRTISILELGAGVGAASIAAAAAARAANLHVSILATDQSRQSVALTTANAAMNGANISAQVFDFTDYEEIISAVSDHGRFDLVLGASLEFEKWDDILFEVLGMLTRDGGVIALVHSTNELGRPPVDSSLFEVTRISGLQYGMQTLWKGKESCFEIVLLQKKWCGCWPSF